MQLVNVVGTPVCCHVRGDWHRKATIRRVPLSPGTVNLDGKRATGGVCTLHQRPPTSSPKPQVTSQSRCTTPHCFSNIPCPFLHEAFTSTGSTLYQACGNFAPDLKNKFWHRYFGIRTKIYKQPTREYALRVNICMLWSRTEMSACWLISS